MKVTLVGGMDRLEPHYQRAARAAGHSLKIFSQYQTGMDRRIGDSDVVVIFTDKISHGARHLAVEAARDKGIPLIQNHSSGMSAWKDCLAQLDLRAWAGRT